MPISLVLLHLGTVSAGPARLLDTLSETFSCGGQLSNSEEHIQYEYVELLIGRCTSSVENNLGFTKNSETVFQFRFQQNIVPLPNDCCT